MTGLQLVGLVGLLAFVGICTLLVLFVIADAYDDDTDDPWWDGRRCHTRRMRALGDCTARAGRHGSHPAEGGGR